MKLDSAEVCEVFFTKIREEGKNRIFRCNCGTERKQAKGAGVSNLTSHLKDKHQDWEQIYNDFKKNNPKAKKAPAGSVFFINPKVITLHSWLDWIVTENLPISAVEKRSFREYSNLESISVDTFEKYLKLVEAGIEKNLKTELPTDFGLIIDGWTEGSTHYFGVFASHRKNGNNYTRFLTISPPVDETSFSAQITGRFPCRCRGSIGQM